MALVRPLQPLRSIAPFSLLSLPTQMHGTEAPTPFKRAAGDFHVTDPERLSNNLNMHSVHVLAHIK